MRVGGVTFEQTLKIETVMPNRLKINISFGENVNMLSSGTISGELSSTLAARRDREKSERGREGLFHRTARRNSTYADYIFDDPSRKYEPEDTVIFDGALGETGKRQSDQSLKPQAARPAC